MSLPAFRRFSTVGRLIVENLTNFFGAKQTTVLGEDSALAGDPAQPRHGQRVLVANGSRDFPPLQRIGYVTLDRKKISWPEIRLQIDESFHSSERQCCEVRPLSLLGCSSARPGGGVREDFQ
jgi:hypothetical protein